MRTALLLLIGLPLAASAQQWTTGPSMLHARAAHAVVATPTGIYAFAGSGVGSRPVMEAERFDGTSWVRETTIPEGLNAPAAAAIGDRIYLIGGFSGVSNLPTDHVRIYGTRTKQWTDAAPLPAARGGHAAVVVNGKIHVFGGGNNRSTIADHSVYDPATNQWTDRAPLPRSEGSPAGVVFRNQVWAIGGRSGPNDFGDVYIYDATADRWNTGPSIEPRGTAGAVVFDNTIWLIGGESQAKNASLNSVLRLSADRTKWTEAAPMPTARNYARAVVFRNAIWTVGGSPRAGASHSSAGSGIVERFGR
jgi:N-acetylneuraminic acid mutarotase